MANFTVRVELHQATGADYDALHAAMEQVGFSRLITGDNGQTYHAHKRFLMSDEGWFPK